ncbi:hypothetical protein SAY86_018717 [Trapa natans]|uniref:Dof zinc finger protein n=1 Tax=Trapa natans TaxID=22666 RepID=A0AAN7LHE4_TRANT|nr:hypothetical protein SAY86_018717 [Trapa natans]
MVFPSIPIFQDPPNWQQILRSESYELQNIQMPPLPSSVSPPPATNSQSRPSSMADRARLAKIPLPEAALKCPRCESTNTKFCYYNNYSLTQPRHFCKTCRRYWTRGGALRNVPVGGGCRKNKRSKGRGSSKSQAAMLAASGSSTTSGGPLPPPLPPQPPLQALTQLPFLPPLQSLSDLGDMEFQAGTANIGIMPPNGLLVSDQQWRVQQFPFLASSGAMQAGGLLQFDQSNEGTNSNQDLNLTSRDQFGLSGCYNGQAAAWSVNGNDSINAWADASGLVSSLITSHHE